MFNNTTRKPTSGQSVQLTDERAKAAGTLCAKNGYTIHSEEELVNQGYSPAQIEIYQSAYCTECGSPVEQVIRRARLHCRGVTDELSLSAVWEAGAQYGKQQGSIFPSAAMLKQQGYGQEAQIDVFQTAYLSHCTFLDEQAYLQVARVVGIGNKQLNRHFSAEQLRRYYGYTSAEIAAYQQSFNQPAVARNEAQENLRQVWELGTQHTRPEASNSLIFSRQNQETSVDTGDDKADLDTDTDTDIEMDTEISNRSPFRFI